MRCLACNTILTDYEATRRYKSTGGFVDLCNHCYNESDVPTLEIQDRPDLAEYEECDGED